MTKPNIHQHTAAICKKLGLEPNMVRRLDITPRSVTAEVYLADENGSKYVVPTKAYLNDTDYELTTQVAMETRTFEVNA